MNKLPTLEKNISLESLFLRKDLLLGKEEWPGWNRSDNPKEHFYALSKKNMKVPSLLQIILNRISNNVHRKSLHGPANILIVHKQDLKYFKSPLQRLRNWCDKIWKELEFPMKLMIDGVEEYGTTNDGRYFIFLTKHEYMKNRIFVARAAEGMQYHYDETNDDFPIPEIHVTIAEDERFFIGNLSHIGILEIV